MTNDMNEASQLVAAAHAAADQPGATLRALDAALRATVGHKLFTVLIHDAARGHIRRAYSNMPAEYPLGGTKPIVDSPWMRQVLGRGEPYVGRNREDIQSVFSDYELIWSLGCESVLNMPVNWNGTVVATLNLLHQSGWYDRVDPATIAPLAQLAVPAIHLLHED